MENVERLNTLLQSRRRKRTIEPQNYFALEEESSSKHIDHPLSDI